MGVIKRGILGGFSGKVGSIVGSSWKGIAVIKSLPLSVANPRTAAQTANRTAFKATGEFAASILGQWIKPLWDRFASQMSGYNAFMKVNVKKYSASSSAPYAGFIMANGKMEATDITVSDPTAGSDSLTVSWADKVGKGLQLPNDQIFVLGFDGTTGKNVVVNSEKTRADGLVTLIFPNEFVSGEHINVNLVARREDGTLVSEQSAFGFLVA